MGLNYHNRVIADTQILRLSGNPGVGVQQIRFSVEFFRAAWPDAEGNGVALTNICARVSVGKKAGATSYLGIAYPERPMVLTPTQYSDKTGFLFDLDLSPQQMFKIEKLRSGGDLYFEMELMGQVFGPNGNCPAYDIITKLVTLSDWSHVLITLGYADILVLGFEIPTGQEGAAAADAAERLRRAQEDLLRGRYDAVVAQCRLVVEGISIGSDEVSAGTTSAEKYANRKERKLMTKNERALFIGEAIRHFTHLAHHPNSDGTQETFNRADAQAILACTVAFVDGALSRARSKID